MSFQQVGKIGRPGPSTKYKVPAGFTLYRATGQRNNFAGELNRGRIIENLDIDPMFRMQAVNYAAGEIVILVKNLSLERAVNWNGSFWNMEAEIEAFFFDKATQTSPAVSLPDSPSCSIGDQERRTASLQNLTFSCNNLVGDSPSMNIRLLDDEDSAGSTLCFARHKFELLALLPTDKIVEVNESPGGLSNYNITIEEMN